MSKKSPFGDMRSVEVEYQSKNNSNIGDHFCRAIVYCFRNITVGSGKLSAQVRIRNWNFQAHWRTSR